MKNTRNTRVQKQQKKDKLQRRFSSTLMCGLVLLSSTAPIATVLADNETQPTTQQAPTQPTEQSKVAPSSDSVKPSTDVQPAPSKAEQPATPETTPQADTTKQDTQSKKATASDDWTVTVHFVDGATGATVTQDITVKGTANQDYRNTSEYSNAMKDAMANGYHQANNDPNSWSPFTQAHQDVTVKMSNSFEKKYQVGADGFYHEVNSDGSLDMNHKFVDFTVNYTDKNTGTILGTDFQEKSDAGAGLTSGTYGHGFDENTWAMEKDASPYINLDHSMDYNGKTYYYDLELTTLKGQVKPVNGIINLTVPLTNMTDDQKYVSWNIRYVDENGKDLITPDAQSTPVGATGEVLAEDLSYLGYKLKSGEKNDISYTVTDGMKDIVFHYVKNFGNLTFTFKDVDTGKEIKSAYTTDGQPNTYFDGRSDENKDKFAIKGYTITDESDNDLQQQFPEGGKTTSVVLKYKKNDTPDPVEQGSVTFKYVDGNSNELQKPKTIKGDVDSKFSESAPTIDGYKLDTSKSDETYSGQFSKQGQTYYFVYNKDNKPDPVEQGTITVNYLDADTGKSIQEATVKTGDVDTAFDFTAPTIEGYSLNSDKSDSLKNIKFTKTAQTINLKYDKEQSSLRPVLVKAIKDAKPYVDTTKYEKTYVDKLSTAIQSAQDFLDNNPEKASFFSTIVNFFTGNSIDDQYQAHIDQVNGAVKEVEAHPVTPVAKGTVTFKYVDQDGKSLGIEDKTVEGNVGDKFSEDAPAVDGYTLDTYKSKQTIDGTYTDKAQTFTFVYTKNADQDNFSVTFDIYDESNTDKPIKTVKVDLPKGTTEYNGLMHKDDLFKVEGYTYVSGLGTKMEVDERGQNRFPIIVSKDAKPDPTVQSVITFNFVDESGKELKASHPETGNQGDTYTVDPTKGYYEIKGYTLKNKDLKFTFGAKDQSVTLVYTKDVTPDPTPDPTPTPDNGGSDDNGSDTNNNGGDKSKNKGADSKTDSDTSKSKTSKDGKDTLPSTGESNTLWMTVAGISAVLAIGFALVFKRKRN